VKVTIFTIALLLILDDSSFGQNISFQLFRRNQCDGSVEKFGFYSLKKDATRFGPTDTTYSCYLKDTGTYKLDFYGEERVYHFNDSNGKYFDTLNFPKIEECYQMHVFVGYCCCNEKCNGLQIDYYTNGNKRMEGLFNNGKAVGALKFYYPNGHLRRIEKYSRKGKKIKTRDFR
jgi:hypothetical protein